VSLLQKKASKKQKKKNKKVHVAVASENSVDKIKYTSQYEDGFMHIVGNEGSKMYRLGDLEYEVSTANEQMTVGQGYTEGLNRLEKNSRYQLLVLNKKVKSDVLDDVLLPYYGDGYDDLREEMNNIMIERYDKDQRNFEIEKYAIFSSSGKDEKSIKHSIDVAKKNYSGQFEAYGVDLAITELEGLDRLKIMSDMLRPSRYFAATYQDIAVSGKNSKYFITPKRFSFPKDKDYIRMGQDYGRVLFVRNFPKYLEDTLIKDICDTGIELAISIHARPYDLIESRKNTQNQQTLNNLAISKEQKDNFKTGVGEDMLSGEVQEIKEATQGLLEAFKSEGQKLFSGIFTVFVTAPTLEKLDDYTQEIMDAGHGKMVEFESVELYKEEALNTVLPLGKPYLDVEMNYMRDMTTANVVSQIPWTNVEMQSPTGQYYGQNQKTNNMIVIDRRQDLIAPTGLILGSTGSGKGMTAKWEILSTLLKCNRALKRLKERMIIVDPESEYLPIGEALGAEILEISSGTKNYLNILDLPDKSLLKKEDQTLDLVKDKANLLVDLFKELLTEFGDVEATLVDRVTRLTYGRFDGTGKMPTLVNWYRIMQEQPEVEAKYLAVKLEKYAIGSQDVFAHETNVDLSANFIIFNTKKLDNALRPFALKVILDQIWNQVVLSQGKFIPYIYFDEIQVNFSTEDSANWFSNLWARIRKYGGVPTGITQNIAFLLNREAGRSMISNSEIITLLRQKAENLKKIAEVMTIPKELLKYISGNPRPGSGLISAGGVTVPFENPIPDDTKLYELMNTTVEI